MRCAVAVLAAACALLGAADEPAAAIAAADRAYGEGLAGFDRAQTANALARGEDAKRELSAARTALDDAVARYRAVIATTGTVLPDVERHLGEALSVGRACCGRESLWKRYGVAETPPTR